MLGVIDEPIKNGKNDAFAMKIFSIIYYNK